MLIKNVIYFFDKLEDHVRGKLSRYPIIYALIGGPALVLFWRGIWHYADEIELSSVASIFLGVIILLITGLFTSVFIGDQIIMSGLKHDKKISEETEQEVKSERDILLEIQTELGNIQKKLKK